MVTSGVHAAIGRAGVVLPYTRNEASARGLLPDDFEWMDPTYSGGTVYAACRRSGTGADGFPYLHYGQWGRTLPLAMCGAVVRAYAGLAKG
jgi:hypothetical protein